MAVALECGLKFVTRPIASDGHGSRPLRLQQDEVHVWYLPLSEADSGASRVREFLSPDELERASRFRFEKHRAQFTLTRGKLRFLLAEYLGVAPREISFIYSNHEKPGLPQAANRMGLEFNLSHTEGMAIFAFTLARRVGVDIENVRTDFHANEIAERFFSEAERAALRAVPAAQLHQCFLRIWTRKEAYIKALGEGLSHPLHQFDVSLDDDARLLATRPEASEARHWQLENLAIAPGFVSAAAVETTGESAGTT